MSDLKNSIKRVMVPINKEGYFIIAVSCAITFLLLMLNDFVGGVGVVATLFIVYFFRDPERVSPDDEKAVLASADGVVDTIEEAFAPLELNLDSNEKFNRISIFLNTFNVHTQRIPFSGKIEKLEYIQGKFLNITNDKYHVDNERQLCLMKTKDNQNIIFAQIAGMVARRIVCNLKEGQEIVAGERFGCIKFGSRVDVYLPKSFELKVKIGQTMIAGESVIALSK